MNTIKSLLIALIVCASMIAVSNANATEKSSTLKSLNNQLYKEINDVLNTPVTLAFSDKMFKGTAVIIMEINQDGKFFIKNIISENTVLSHYISSKIITRNLWTDIKFAKETFVFKVNVV